jgi:hypothetical protein
VPESDWTSLHFRLSCHNHEPFIEREKSMIDEDMIRGWMKSTARLKKIAQVGDCRYPQLLSMTRGELSTGRNERLARYSSSGVPR